MVSIANSAVEKWQLVQECIQKKLLWYKGKVEKSAQQLNQIETNLSNCMPFIKEGEEIKPLNCGTNTLRKIKSRLEETINSMKTELELATHQHAKELSEISQFGTQDSFDASHSPEHSDDVPSVEQNSPSPHQSKSNSPICDDLDASSPQRKRLRLSEDLAAESTSQSPLQRKLLHFYIMLDVNGVNY